MNATTQKFVTLNVGDLECGIVDADGAREQAQQLANERNTTITVRDVGTDKVLATVKPRGAKAAADARRDQSRASAADRPPAR
jgi:hypothetical protein